MEVMEGRTMEEVRLEQLHRIAAERDQEYNGIKKVLDERQEDLDRREQELEERSRKLEEMKEDFCRREKELSSAEEKIEVCKKTLADQNTELEKRAEELSGKEREVEKKAADIALECSILKENVRNEELKASRLRMEWENKCARLERTGAVPVETSESKESEAYQALEGKVAELSRKLTEAQAENGLLKQENGQLKQEKERLEEEKGDILRKALGISRKAGQEKEADKAPEQVSEEKPEGKPEKEPESIFKEVYKDESMETGKEELTAEVLCRYLKHYFPGEELTLRHAETGEQIHLLKGGLKYVFVFEDPARFDIRAGRKKTKELLQRIEEVKGKHPGLEFAYDDREEEVVVSGYFIRDMLPGELMEKITKVSELFRQGEGYEYES